MWCVLCYIVGDVVLMWCVVSGLTLLEGLRKARLPMGSKWRGCVGSARLHQYLLPLHLESSAFGGSFPFHTIQTQCHKNSFILVFWWGLLKIHHHHIHSSPITTECFLYFILACCVLTPHVLFFFPFSLFFRPFIYISMNELEHYKTVQHNQYHKKPNARVPLSCKWYHATCKGVIWLLGVI